MNGQLPGAQALAATVREWLDTRVLPVEASLAAAGPEAAAHMARLGAAARAAGLWGLHYPPTWGGKVYRLSQYLPVAEAEGRSEFGPAIFGSEATLDAHMLHRYGSPTVRERYLAPLVRGETVSSYGMSEPGGAGSVPATIRTSAHLEGGQWRINGRKWFISRAEAAGFMTVMARTRPALGADESWSMIVVPAAAEGFRIERTLEVFGCRQGHCEVSFTDVRVPADHMLGDGHDGLVLMHKRLGLGRLLRSAHWLGLAQRCFDLMCARIGSARGRLAGLADKQLARQHVFETHLALAGARALVHAAAVSLENGEADGVAVNLAKVAASRALERAADSAIQIHGAEGVSELTPLSGIHRMARTTRILDGTEEALISAVGRALLGGTATPARSHDHA